MKICILGITLTALLCSGTLPAQTPPLINYQGRIVVGSTNFNSPPNGQFKFALVNAGVNLSTPATAIAIVNAGQVVSMAIDAPGSGYTVAPMVTINHPTGTGATAVATITNGSVTGLRITNGGSGYSSNPTITIAPPPPDIITTRFWNNDGDGVGPANEPTNSIALPVTKGLYSVLLGDTTIDNMAAIPASVFTQPDLRLRVWFSDSVNGFQLLSPDQRLAPTGYLSDGAVSASAIMDQAIVASKIAPNQIQGIHVATGAIGANQLAGGAVNVSHLGVPAPSAGQVLGYNGIDIAWMAGGVFSLNGTDAYYNDGNVGIGTDHPQAKLDVRGGMVLETGANAAIFTGTGNGELNRYLHLGNSPTFATASGLKAGGILVANDYTYANPGKSDLVVQGKIAIGTGTTIPAIKFTVQTIPGLGVNNRYGFEHTNGAVRLTTYLADTVGGSGAFIGTRSNDALQFFVNGGVGSPGLTIYTSNNARFAENLSVRTLTIRGGADLAEPFIMKEGELEKGSVVVIDEDHPGRLTRSSKAYDTRVAGIISGANGVNPGIALHQEGVIEGGQNVALNGRVYVRADATSAAIKPGDLLTTSDNPGHAMKVADHPRAQGAVIGKAMSSLEEGTGMVLVLVTLQ